MTFVRIVLAVSALGLLAGCSGDPRPALETTCSKWNTMSDSDRDALAVRLLDERGDSMPSELTVSTTRVKIGTACFVEGNQRTRIGELL